MPSVSFNELYKEPPRTAFVFYVHKTKYYKPVIAEPRTRGGPTVVIICETRQNQAYVCGLRLRKVFLLTGVVMIAVTEGSF